jgi:hypothetical protein
MAWSTAMLTVCLLAWGWLAWHPSGDLTRCREAYQAARFPTTGTR